MSALEQLKTTYGFGPGASFVETEMPGLHFFWSTEPVPRAPLIYNAGLVVILEGHKIGFLDDKVFRYDPDHYLVLSVPVPFDCETHASPGHPLLGLFVDVDRTVLLELVNLLDDVPAELPPYDAPASGIAPVEVSDSMRQTVDRLLEALCSPVSSRVIGPGLVRELLFHALRGPHGGVLHSLARENSHAERISRSITVIRSRYFENLSIDELAGEAGMSPSVFHRAFKTMTGSSPHQYLKATRLQRAKGFLLAQGLPVGEAARKVGYENPAHFSREFKKYFRVSPQNAQKSMYTPVDL